LSSTSDRVSFEDWQKLWKSLKGKFEQQDVKWRTLAVFHEAGDIAKAVRYMTYECQTAGNLAEIKKGLGDLLAQAYMLALCCGLDLKEVERIGYEELKYAIEKRLPK
jgi:NTP pyrophosphatase (non-canonical NTP hydrolase)